MLAGPEWWGCAKVLASDSWKVAYGLMSSDDSVKISNCLIQNCRVLSKVPTWYLVSRMQSNFVYRGIVSIPLNFRLLQVFIRFLAVLLPLSCEV